MRWVTGGPANCRATAALDMAAAAGGHATVGVDPGQSLHAGAAVSVTPVDYATDAVVGTLVGLDRTEVVVARDDERAGRVHVHFPRIGYQLKALVDPPRKTA